MFIKSGLFPVHMASQCIRNSVALLRGDDAPDAAARARRVTMGARDEVAVEVHDGLACRLAAIHPHVVAIRLVTLLDPGFRQVQNRRQRPLLLRRQAEPC